VAYMEMWEKINNHIPAEAQKWLRPDLYRKHLPAEPEIDGDSPEMFMHKQNAEQMKIGMDRSGLKGEFDAVPLVTTGDLEEPKYKDFKDPNSGMTLEERAMAQFADQEAGGGMKQTPPEVREVREPKEGDEVEVEVDGFSTMHRYLNGKWCFPFQDGWEPVAEFRQKVIQEQYENN
jgi:hypothetical protein